MTFNNCETDLKISIGIPLFRDDAAANFAVESAISQQSPVTEIIISDNNTNRDSKDIQRWSRDTRVRYINSGTNIGPVGNFIRCWEEARERFFLWLGDDDFLNPSFAMSIKKQILKSRENTVAWSSLPSTHRSDTGTIISGDRFSSIDGASPAERVLLVHESKNWNYFFYSVYDRNKISIENLKFFHSSWPSHYGNFDWAWTYAVAMSGTISLVPEQLYFYCFNNWSNHHEYSRREAERFSAFLEHETSISDTQVLLALNSAVLMTLYAARHCIGAAIPNCRNSTDVETIQPSRSIENLFEILAGVFFEQLRETLIDATSPLSQEVRSVIGKESGQGFLLAIVDLLDSQLKRSHGTSRIVSEVLCGVNSGSYHKLLDGLNCLNLKSNAPLSSIYERFRTTSMALKMRSIGSRFKRGRMILHEENTRLIFLPIQR